MDMCVEKIEHFLNEEIGVFFKVKGGQASQAPTSKPFSKIHCFCLTTTNLGLTKTLNSCIEIMFQHYANLITINLQKIMTI